MKVLVTGGAGFLGSHLCARLVTEGHQVICVDNFYTGSIDNLSTILKHPAFEIVKHDVCEQFDFDVDYVLNFACPASPVHYQKDPIFTIRTSFLGAYHSLELARKKGIPFLQASTSEVYGDPELHPQDETYWGKVNPIGIRSCYDEGKRAAESLIYDFHRTHNLDVRVVRIFNTYGPNMSTKDGRVVSNFITQAISNKPITLYGAGNQSRSFCYVDDLIDGIYKVMMLPNYLKTPINLGNPNEQTMFELAQMVLELTNSDSKIIYEDLPQDDPKRRKPDISLAEGILQWHPRVDLRTGLLETIEYFREKLSM